jgi:hypothetical protein
MDSNNNDNNSSSILDVPPFPELANDSDADANSSSSPAASGLRYRHEQGASKTQRESKEDVPQSNQMTEKTHPMVLREHPHRSSSTTLALFSPNTKKKLQFYSDSESVPVQLNQVQMQTLRRRHEFHTHIYNLQCRLATLTAKLAEEVMDRDQQIIDMKRNQIYPPLDDLATKLDLKNEQQSSPTHQWLSLESRLATLDAQMTHSIHVRLAEQQQEHGDELRTQIDTELRPVITEDNAKHVRREKMAVRKYEQQAGTMARHYREEHATRIATIECARKRYEALQLQRSAELNERMRTLRIQLEDERANRIAQDERNRQYVLQTVQKLKDAILVAYGIADDDDDDEQDDDDGRGKEMDDKNKAENEIPRLSI